MGCGGRVKAAEIRADQKWDFISLGDFKSTNCLSIFAYVYLLGSLVVSIAVYGVDTFTAVQLLAHDKWAGKIEPKLDPLYTKWIFSACIIASWVNLAYEYMRALRVIKRGAVVESYLDSLAVRLQCIRWTKTGRGWRRFLVFAELTKNKKGAEYVALFTYFAFQAWIRIIFCQGPRQVVNSLTLYALLTSKLIPTGDNDIGSAIGNFFQKIGKVAEEDYQSAIIYSGMFFTLVIWVFGALSLILAGLFWLFFLCYYCPQSEGGLSGYCEKKTNKRLASIVSVKVNKALEEEERKRRKEDAKAMKKGEQPKFGRQATLPTLFNPVETKDTSTMPTLNRNDTVSTLPKYTSRPGTPGGAPTTATFELNDLERKRPPPGRTLTNASYSSNAPLMGNASDMGYGRPESPAPSLPPSRAGFPPPIRTMTASSQRSQWSAQGTPNDDRGYTASPVSYGMQPPLPSHVSTISSGSMVSNDSFSQPRPMDRSYTPSGLAPSMGRRTPFNENGPPGGSVPYPMGFDDDEPLPPRGPSEFGRSSPALSALGRGQKETYQAFNPQNRSASVASPAPYPTSSPPRGPQNRNVTDPGSGRDYFGDARPGTAQGNRTPMSRGPPQDYFGDARPGTAQGNRPPPQEMYGGERAGTSQSRRPAPQEMYGGERPGTSQSQRPMPQEMYGGQRPGTSQSRRPPPQELYGGERPGTSQSQNRRTVPNNQASFGSSTVDNRQPRLPDIY